METSQKLNHNTTPPVEYTLLRQHIESLIFASSQPIPLVEIRRCVETVLNVLLPEIQILEEIQSLQARYLSSEYAFEIVEINGGFQFLTKGAYHETIGTYLRQTIKKKLSQAALETLAIIAYKQPISKTELEVIRGVNCDYAIQKLLEKELVYITGRSEAAGRPLLYGTSEKFMDYFGISSLKDLPKLKDLKQPENEIGVAE
ncbi:MAG: SMC-Scp complex subunit ScpB [Saprospiraceae bacterium]|nr:SMC-Scp complex subunit ScpB [Saprospiraceae bacterium]